MRRPVRLLLIFVLTLIGALVIAMVLSWLYFSGERILAVVQPQLEERLDRPFEIDGASLSFWGGLGVRLEGVRVGNIPDGISPHLLNLDQLDIKVRFWPLLSGNVHFDRVIVGPGELRLEVDALGRPNWTGLTRPDTTLVTEPVVDSALAELPQLPVAENMVFTDVVFSYDDRAADRYFEMTISQGRASFVPYLEDDSVAITGGFTVPAGVYQSDSLNLDLAAFQPNLAFDLKVDLAEKIIRSENSQLTLSGVPIDLSGRYQLGEDSADYEVTATIPPITLAEIIEYLPEHLWQSYFPTAPPQGSLEADLTITAPPRGVNLPYVDGKIQVTGFQGAVGSKEIPLDVGGIDIRLNGTVASLTTQSMTLAGQPMAVTLTLDNPEDPNFSGRASGELDLAQIAAREWGGTSSGSTGGTVKLNLSTFGQVELWRDLQVNGDLILDKVRWSSADTAAASIDEITGKLVFRGHDMRCEKIQIRSERSRAEITGDLTGLMPYLTRLGEGVEKPAFDFEMRSPYFDLDPFFADQENTTTDLADPAVEEGLPIPLIDLTAQGRVIVDSGIYYGVPFGGLTAEVTYADWKLNFENARARVYGGTATGTAEFDYTDWDEPAFMIETEATKIGANEFLTDFTGFGGHLYGLMNFKAVFAGHGEETPDILKTLSAQGATSMAEGRFEGVSLLSSLAEQTGVAQLADSGPIRDLKTTFWVDRGRVYCNDWKFTSSNILYDVVGSVGFDGTLDYRIGVSLDQKSGGGGILGAIDGLLGGGGGSALKLHLSLTGEYANPQLQIDSRDSQDALRNKLESGLRDALSDLKISK